MTANRLDIDNDWTIIRSTFERAQSAGLCHVFSTINDDGTPNITPIGSLVLHANRCAGYYFDVFNRTMADNLDRNPNVAILAVDSRKLFWIKSLYIKKFPTPPAIRLIGTVSSKRSAKAEEVKQCLQEVRTLKRFGASKRIGNRLKHIRDVEFTRVDSLNIGMMTNHAW